MEYIIVEANNTIQLQARVNDKIRQGYYPQGAPVYNPVTGDWQLMQAMVKEER